MGATQSRNKTLNEQIINLEGRGKTRKGRTAANNLELKRLFRIKKFHNMTRANQVRKTTIRHPIEGPKSYYNQFPLPRPTTKLRTTRYTPDLPTMNQLMPQRERQMPQRERQMLQRERQMLQRERQMPGLTGNIRHNLNQYHLRQNKNRLSQQLGNLNIMTRRFKRVYPESTAPPPLSARPPLTKRRMLVNIGLLPKRVVWRNNISRRPLGNYRTIPARNKITPARAYPTKSIRQLYPQLSTTQLSQTPEENNLSLY